MKMELCNFEARAKILIRNIESSDGYDEEEVTFSPTRLVSVFIDKPVEGSDRVLSGEI
jgi:hypothetical protein